MKDFPQKVMFKSTGQILELQPKPITNRKPKNISSFRVYKYLNKRLEGQTVDIELEYLTRVEGFDGIEIMVA